MLLTVSYGVGDTIGRVSFNVNARWTDRMPFSPTYNVWQQQNTKISLSLNIRLTDHISPAGVRAQYLQCAGLRLTCASTPNFGPR